MRGHVSALRETLQSLTEVGHGYRIPAISVGPEIVSQWYLKSQRKSVKHDSSYEF